MKLSKKSITIISIIVAAVLVVSGVITAIVLTTGNKKKDSIVIMTEALSGLFNPFYATSGTDMDVVGLTQIGMLSTDDDGNPQAGDDLPTVVKDFSYVINDLGGDNKETVYTFVIKNGLKFSDGEPLTINDVFFNLYEYLDIAYTGSSTMYSIKIKGLSNYRTQSYSSDDTTEERMSEYAVVAANTRVAELIRIYTDNGLRQGTTNSYHYTEEQMKQAINDPNVVDISSLNDYKKSMASDEELAALEASGEADAYFRKALTDDYELALTTFKKELETDWLASQDAFDVTTEPYKSHASKFNSETFKFLLYEGNITPEYAKIPGTSRDDKTKIVKFNNETAASTYNTKEAAINKVYTDTVNDSFHMILMGWGTAATLQTQFAAEARSVWIKNNSTASIENIEGIKSLGHNTNETSVTVNGKNYKVARNHDEKGRPTAADEYDVLRITVDGTDPKAIYIFGFTVAPAHYYTADADHPNGRTIDIANNKFGVEFADTKFQTNVIQSQQHVEVPLGAGPFKATDIKNSDNPTGAAFNSSNIVYYKGNENFMFPVKAEKLRLKVVSSTNAIDALKNGEVDYITPQFTKTNADELNKLESKGIKQLHGWQLGYGYIGINAGKVPDIHIRRAIMAAMDVTKATEYYYPGTCIVNNWPMSTQSWAYPFDSDNTPKDPTVRDSERRWAKYATYTDQASRERAKARAKEIITSELEQADPSANKKIRFTIAGASITEHPTYNVFKEAAELLNTEFGFEIEVRPDSQALTKLSTGSLEVWAAAWGSTIDPDMYQVYHKDSSATSVYAWGYREIKADAATYWEEQAILNELSAIIDDARSLMDQNQRKQMYEEAMKLVLDLSVELPVYQRQTLYAYNSKAITGLTVKTGEGGLVNSYSSPLERSWELELVK